MSEKGLKSIPLDEYLRNMPRPLSDPQVAEYLQALEADISAHEFVVCGGDRACLDDLSPKEQIRVARQCAGQIHRYISENKLDRDAFRQLQEAQDNWAREKVAARVISESVDSE
ncbi:hypothetical protein [Ruegeria arenilitoris]|uniref:hypothetical protein n=1 Tax=Ruegeria arenilitoris TaxID=1173585 RepID=UPI00147E9D3C|nr:hypothetical protein [Ruegeria arenilitoris]